MAKTLFSSPESNQMSGEKEGPSSYELAFHLCRRAEGKAGMRWQNGGSLVVSQPSAQFDVSAGQLLVGWH
jgi:hypothetical protein